MLYGVERMATGLGYLANVSCKGLLGITLSRLRPGNTSNSEDLSALWLIFCKVRNNPHVEWGPTVRSVVGQEGGAVLLIFPVVLLTLPSETWMNRGSISCALVPRALKICRVGESGAECRENEARLEVY